MRREPHPISGALYEEIGEGVVQVDDPKSGRRGKFHSDGTWLEGELTHADPQFLLFVGGPKLPEGKNVYWGMSPPVDGDALAATAADAGAAYSGRSISPDQESEAPRSVAKYTGDPGRMTEQGMRSAGHVELDYILKNDRRPDLVPEAFWLESPAPGGPTKVPTARF